MILVIGKNGNLAASLRFIEPNFTYISKEDYNIEIVNKLSPKLIINAAAYTNVDLAETEKDHATKINFEIPKELSLWCNSNNANFIHISTDYVFDGKKNSPYSTHDPANPLNFYGYTKLLGENEVLNNCSNSIIIRTSWLYSPFAKNFAVTMFSLLKKNSEVKVVNDQTGNPTSAINLARIIIKISKNFIPGLYHYADNQTMSWYDFACAISKKINSGNVISIKSSEYPSKCIRPSYSVLDSNKICQTYQINQYNFSESLGEFFLVLNNEE